MFLRAKSWLPAGFELGSSRSLVQRSAPRATTTAHRFLKSRSHQLQTFPTSHTSLSFLVRADLLSLKMIWRLGSKIEGPLNFFNRVHFSINDFLSAQNNQHYLFITSLHYRRKIKDLWTFLNITLFPTYFLNWKYNRHQSCTSLTYTLIKFTPRLNRHMNQFSSL